MAGSTVPCSRCGARFGLKWKQRPPYCCGICQPRDAGVDWKAVPPSWQGLQRNQAIEANQEILDDVPEH